MQILDTLKQWMRSMSGKKHMLDQKRLLGKKKCAEYKRLAIQYWHTRQKTERLYLTVLLSMGTAIFVQIIWIAALQYQVCQLTDAVGIQEIRIAQLEQLEKKQNELMYSTHATIWDIRKKWNDLNFRVLENSWKLDNKDKKSDTKSNTN